MEGHRAVVGGDVDFAAAYIGRIFGIAHLAIAVEVVFESTVPFSNYCAIVIVYGRNIGIDCKVVFKCSIIFTCTCYTAKIFALALRGCKCDRTYAARDCAAIPANYPAKVISFIILGG